jgi:hypothetical protein
MEVVMTTMSLTAVLSEDVLRRICGEYAEMPGLRVTQQQAQRLWALDAATCRAALEFLTSVGFLCKKNTEQYARLTDGPATFPSFRMAKADRLRPAWRAGAK